MYYIFYDKDRQKLNGAGQCPVLNEEILTIEVDEETYNNYLNSPTKYIYNEGEIIENPNYEKEQAEARKEKFYKEFIATSLGNYRLQPRGYSNAQQAMDVTNTMAQALGGLTEQIASLITFYPTPDFTEEAQCTEEWLIENQVNPSPMALEEWTAFYLNFCESYAMNQHKQ